MSRGRRRGRSGRRGAAGGATGSTGAGGARELPAREPEGADPDVAAANRYGLVMAALFGAVGVLLLALSVAGRGWPYLLGGIDFLAIAAVLAWALRNGWPSPRSSRAGGRS
jgi:hypothetical protein